MIRRSSVPVRRNRKGHPSVTSCRQRLSGKPLKRTIASDEILWMRDVVQLTGKHRSTIHRWIHRGFFPPKNAPRGQPTGWLRSTIEQWLLGSPPTSQEVEPDARL
jgi:predicted DNA-binding transcriptional regulator AlpA